MLGLGHRQHIDPMVGNGHPGKQLPDPTPT